MFVNCGDVERLKRFMAALRAINYELRCFPETVILSNGFIQAFVKAVNTFKRKTPETLTWQHRKIRKATINSIKVSIVFNYFNDFCFKEIELFFRFSMPM